MGGDMLRGSVPLPLTALNNNAPLTFIRKVQENAQFSGQITAQFSNL